MDKKDDQPAFPLETQWTGSAAPLNGMTLRQWYAGKAMETRSRLPFPKKWTTSPLAKLHVKRSCTPTR